MAKATAGSLCKRYGGACASGGRDCFMLAGPIARAGDYAMWYSDGAMWYSDGALSVPGLTWSVHRGAMTNQQRLGTTAFPGRASE